MTATNLTASISNIAYPVINTSTSLKDNSDETSDLSLTIFDANGTYSFQFGQAITITDTFEGVKFTGYISDATATRYEANTALAWKIDCVDNHLLAMKKTSNRVINNQYAGVAAASMVNDYLAADGVVANYAIRDDNTQSDFAQGTLSGTVATSNLGGDLELVPAGTTVTYHDGGTISSSYPAIKFVGTASSGYGNNLYTYRMIYSDYSTTIGNQDAIYYEIWIQSNSPQIMAGVDVVCTDGTTLRDSVNGGTDGQGIKAHPSNDLSGFANNNAWYSRTIPLGSDLAGKTLAYVSIAFEGDQQGTYTAFFRNVQYYGVNSSNFYFTKINIFNSTSPTLQSNAQLQNNGYYNVSVSTVTAYDNLINFVYQTHSIDAVKIVQSSIMSWQTSNIGNITNALGQVINNGATASVQTSIDNGATWQTATNNAAIPNLLPGMVVSGRSVQYRVNLLMGIDPTLAPFFNSFVMQVTTAYQSSKTDIIKTYTTQSDFNGGTYSNTQSTGDGVLTDLGAAQNFDVSGFSQTTWGSNVPFSAPLKKQIYLQSYANADVRWRFDAAGQRQNCIIEVDIKVSANYNTGIVYRTTNWGNSNDSYAYCVAINLTNVILAKGTNSTGSGNPTIITQPSITLSEGSWHRLKVVVSGSNHQVFMDSIQFINANDSTYTAAGYIGLRMFNGTNATQQALFDNLGVISNYTGQWTSPSISLSSLGNYGNSMICCDLNNVPASCNVALVTSIDNGSTYQACTNGGAIPGLTTGQSLSGKNLLVQVQFTAGDAAAQAVVSGVTAWIMGQYSSSGTRISPVLSLSSAGRAGSTAVSWSGSTPAGTGVTIATSLDGVNFTNVIDSNPIPGIVTQPDATLDTFSTHTGPNYTSTFFTSGSTIPWFWDTLNSRLVASGGSLGLLLCNAISAADVDIIIDMDQSDTGGVVWRYNNINNYYQLIVNDASSSNDPNTLMLVKRVGGIRNFLSAGTILFTRGTYRRIRVTMIGSVIAVYFDGVLAVSYTDASPLGAGQVGMSSDTGTARFYNFRIQPQGDNLANKVVYSKVTLTSTDPTQTPQVTDLTVAALNPLIGLGALIPTANYDNTYLSDNFNDFAKKSNYQWYIDPSLNFVFSGYVAQPAPWILQSSDQQLLLDGLSVKSSAPLYRNRMTVKGVVAIGTASESKKGDGTTTSWALGGNITEPPTIYVNGQLKTIGSKGLTTGMDFYWTPDSNAITQDSSGTVLQQTDTILFQNYTYIYTTTITVDNTNLANTVTQKQFAKMMGRTTAQKNVLGLTSAARTSSGNSGDLDVGICRRIGVDINISAVSGTSPTIQFFIDRKDIFGNYFTIWSSSTASAATMMGTSIGAFATINQALGATVRLRWTIGGTSPSFTFSASIIGTIDVQSGNLGVVEVVEDITDQELDIDAATDYCNTALTRYGTIGRTLSFKTIRRNPSLAAGQSLAVFLPEHGINDAQMLITETDMSEDIIYDNGVPSKIYYQTCTASENAILGTAYKLLSSTLK
jgi:hypothetical protein